MMKMMQGSATTRRSFLKNELAALGMFPLIGGCRLFRENPNDYSVTILGDTHFDAAPTSRYHSKWVPRHEKDFRDRQGEFKRNQDMWASRLPRLVAAAARARRADTAYLFQMGDLIQGDCTDLETHLRFFRDAQAACSKGMEDLPFLTVCGNHDIRGGGDKAFDRYILPLAAKAIGRPVESANFMFNHGPDAFVFVDFMRPDLARIDSMLDAAQGARHTFLCAHGTVAAPDTWGPYWFLFGEPEYTEHRREFFSRLLRQRVIVLCGHLHRTQIRRWIRPEGELVEFSASSVWRPQEDAPTVMFDSPAQYGSYVRRHPSRMNEDYDGRLQKRTPEELFALMDEYRPGLVEYKMLQAAGHYQLRVTDRTVDVDFFACDGLTPTETFRLR